MTREWSYWTLNKLAILGDYLPAFNTASKKATTRVYLDLMAGQPQNRERGTGQLFDGSARLAMKASPQFSRVVLIEKDPANAQALREDLAAQFPGDSRGEVYEGDCNLIMDEVLKNLEHLRWSPTFAFVDQQSAEVHWSTLAKVAAFRRGNFKSELWVLMSPAMIIKGVTGTNGDAYAMRVDRLYGAADWRNIWRAWERGDVDPEGFRTEMVNLFRWKVQQDLGYGFTARIPMRMPNNVTIYDMVFCSDHPAGERIMSWLYKAAADREPRMREEHRLRQLNQADAGTLFDITGEMLATPTEEPWTNTPAWDPRETTWWR